MNISALYSSGIAYLNCECVKGFAFRNAAAWAKCAILPVICAILAILQDKCVHLYRIEYLLPRTKCRLKESKSSAVQFIYY